MAERAEMLWLAPRGLGIEYRWARTRVGASCGPTLVLLHEGLGSVSLWRDFPERLAASTRCDVFLYSRPGYGASSAVQLPRPTRYLHDEGLHVLPAVLAAAGIGDHVLIGHSDGGSIAIIHAGGKRDPSTRALVLLAPHVFNEDITRRSIAAARDSFDDSGLRARLARHHGDQVDATFHGWADVWLSDAFRDWNIETFLAAIEVPILLLQGEDDRYGTVRQVEAIQRGASGRVTTRLLSACGHSLQRDQPEVVLRAIAAFLESF